MQNKSNLLHQNCRKLLEAYRTGKLGQTKMPEDSNPNFDDDQIEMRLAYFTLPMALNYQRDSYKLWEAALKTINDDLTKKVRQTHLEIGKELGWHVVNANGSIEEVHKNVLEVVKKLVQVCDNIKK
jgi:hypothetical protein